MLVLSQSLSTSLKKVSRHCKKSFALSSCLMSSEHYDSQSGERYEISDRINIYLLQPNASEIPDLPSSLRKIFHCQEAHVQSFHVRCSSERSVKATIRGLQASLVENARCTILDAFSSSTSSVQTVAAKLCDAGCTQLILAEDPVITQGDVGAMRTGFGVTTPPPMATVDDHDLQEVVEAVVWNDVLGVPMSERVGLRALGSSHAAMDQVWRNQVESALEMNVKNFDASLDGISAPSWEQLVQMFDKLGLQHNLSLKTE